MSEQTATDTTRRVWAWPPGVAALALAGLVGPLLFVLGVILQQGYLGPAYSPTMQEISSLTASGVGWAQQLNFIVFGLLIIAFAAGLHRSVTTTRGGFLGPALLAVNGLQLVVAGVFPMAQTDAGVVYDPIGVHSANGAVFFVGLGLPLIVVSLRLRRDPRWNRLAGYVLGTGVAVVAAVAADVTMVRPVEAALHPWQGIVQRLILVIWLACLVTMAVRARRIAAPDEPTSQDDRPAWVKRFGIATVVVAGVVAMMMFFGGRHGPGMHDMQTGLAGSDATRTVVEAANR